MVRRRYRQLESSLGAYSGAISYRFAGRLRCFGDDVKIKLRVEGLLDHAAQPYECKWFYAVWCVLIERGDLKGRVRRRCAFNRPKQPNLVQDRPHSRSTACSGVELGLLDQGACVQCVDLRQRAEEPVHVQIS